MSDASENGLILCEMELENLRITLIRFANVYYAHGPVLRTQPLQRARHGRVNVDDQN